MTYFRGLNKPDKVVEVTTSGGTAIKILLESGAFHALNNVQWSTAKDRDLIDDLGNTVIINEGTVHFSHQGGNTSVISARVSNEEPLKFNGVDYSSIITLTDELLTSMP